MTINTKQYYTIYNASDLIYHILKVPTQQATAFEKCDTVWFTIF